MAEKKQDPKGKAAFYKQIILKKLLFASLWGK